MPIFYSCLFGLFVIAANSYILDVYSIHCDVSNRAGFKGSCPGPPQLGGLHKTVKKIITQGNIKILFETDNLV